MKIKLGPYKVDRDFWLALQILPGANDEQRVLKALSFAMEMVARAKAAPPNPVEAGVITVQAVDGIPSGGHP